MPNELRPLQARGLTALSLDNRLAALGGTYGATVVPTPLPEPKLIAFNPEAATLIGLDPAAAKRPEFLEVMAGNRELPGACNFATVYAGHQFGVRVPQLGDGRALLIGQVRNERGELWDLQLKGAGKTPYSRFGDGRAVLRSTIREYLCGEALAGLGIPTTRSLCMVGSPEPVQRETLESAAVLCRLSRSHLRFGHFEYFYYRRDFDALGPLADHVIAEYFPHLEHRDYAGWLAEVVVRTARLVAQWQAVGFCHGVMNSDNMSILGLTLDYGPFGFMDAFDATHICNHSDDHGRYAYDQQPVVASWNCSRLLQATLPLLNADPDKSVEMATGILAGFEPAFIAANLANWHAKLGLREVQHSDAELIDRWLQVLHRSRVDFTNAFRLLAAVRASDDSVPELRDHLLDLEGFDAWLPDYRARLRAEHSNDAERATRMNAVNPRYVLRNHLAQQAIEKAQAGDFAEIEILRRLLGKPYDQQPGMNAYAQPPPLGTTPLEVSCSS